MNILLIGTPLFSNDWRLSGHRVIVAAAEPLSAHPDNRRFDFFDHPESCSREVAAMVDSFKPDIIVQGDHSKPLVHCGLEHAACPTAWYAIDTHLHHAWHKHFAATFDLVFCAQKKMLPVLSTWQPAVEWLPLFCQRPSAFEPWQERRHDVAFVGKIDPIANPGRAALFEELRRLGIPVHTAVGDYVPVYRSSRIVVNQSVRDDLNLRFFEAAGCGALLVTDRLSHSMTDFLIEGEDMLLYEHDNAADCAEKIRWALGRPAEAEAMARRAHAKITGRHLASHRAAQAAERLAVLLRYKKRRDGAACSGHSAWAHDYCSRLDLPERLTAFFSSRAEELAYAGRESAHGRAFALVVLADRAIKQGNSIRANALLMQITEPAGDDEFSLRYARLKIEAAAGLGDRAGAEAALAEALQRFPGNQELGTIRNRMMPIS